MQQAASGASRPRSPSPLIRAERVSRRVASPAGELCILDAVTLSVAPGESLAITGVSGSGKSTLLAVLAGLERPSAGRLWWGGDELTELDEEARARLRAGRVGFVFQSFHLLDGLSARDNVMLPLELFGAAAARQRAEWAIAQVGLSDRCRHYPRQLSGGERQRVAIARAFAVRPQLLFADEPTGNLDRRNTERVADLLFSAQSGPSSALVLVTHDVGLAARCDRAVSLEDGRLVAG